MRSCILAYDSKIIIEKSCEQAVTQKTWEKLTKDGKMWSETT